MNKNSRQLLVFPRTISPESSAIEFWKTKPKQHQQQLQQQQPRGKPNTHLK